jgi:hypothetical protein
MTSSLAPADAVLDATAAWSRRVRRVGGFIQVAFAAFWLIRGSLTVGAGIGAILAVLSALAVAGVSMYGVQATAGIAPRPTTPGAKRIERSVTIATVVQLAASFAAPAIVIALGRPDWALPSIAITIGPLLLWLDHEVHIPRYRPAGWALIVGPVMLAAAMSGTALAATTGLAAGTVLLSTAAAGFHDLAAMRAARTHTVEAVDELDRSSHRDDVGDHAGRAARPG